MAYTKGPWNWGVMDYSAAVLHGGLEELDHVITSSPCQACLDHAKRSSSDPEWRWGRCTISGAEAIRFASSREGVIPSGIPFRIALRDADAAIAKAEGRS